MPETVKIPIPCYSMKMQIYPSDAQKEKIDRIFRALHVAYNITFHEVFQKNPMVCRAGKAGGMWPDFDKMAKGEWRNYLIAQNKLIDDAPSDSLEKKNGIFRKDGQRAWKTGMHNCSIANARREDFQFYNRNKQRRSFHFQLSAKNLMPSLENGKVAWITLPKKLGKVKARGFNRKLWFGDGGDHTYLEALLAGELAGQLSTQVSKDSCGSYFVSITFNANEKRNQKLFLESPAPVEQKPVGIDVGIKDIAILSTGQKVENKHFKKEQDAALRRLGRKLSRRWGSANPAFRDYNREIRKENSCLDRDSQIPLAQPSKRYLMTQRQKALIERKIARCRETYYHQQTSLMVRQVNLIAVETLHVKNMLRNHKLAFALNDAAMSDFISKLKYKAERSRIPILPIGMFEPTSQLCSECGAQYPLAKNLDVRDWICPRCGTHHDRDINAAKNILAIALKSGGVTDSELPSKPKRKRSAPTVPRRKPGIYPVTDDVGIIYSKELSSNNNPRYIIINLTTKETLDDAQGAGFRSVSNAKNYYKAKKKWSSDLSHFIQ